MNGPNSFSLLGLVILVLDVIALVDIIQGSMDNTRKVLWALFVLVFPVVGMVVYFIVVKKVLR